MSSAEGRDDDVIVNDDEGDLEDDGLLAELNFS
jgi:hypothetical protein